MYFYLAIKIGRHTYEKKTKDIQEIKRLELQAMMTVDGNLLEVEKRQDELDRIIDRITNVHINSQPRTSNDLVKLVQAEEQFLVQNI